MSPIGASNLRLLNQSTHSSVANSTSSMVRQGPFFRKFPHAQSGTKSDQDDSTPVADANGKGCAWEVRRQNLACFDELIGLGEVQKVRDEILKPV